MNFNHPKGDFYFFYLEIPCTDRKNFGTVHVQYMGYFFVDFAFLLHQKPISSVFS